MASLLKLLALIITINTFMYIGTNYTIAEGLTDSKGIKVPGDYFDILLEDKNNMQNDMDAYFNTFSPENTSINISRNFKVNSNFSSVPDRASGQPLDPTQGSFSFLDPIRLVYGFFATLVNLIIAPITMFSVLDFPPIIAILFGLPLAFLGQLLFWAFIRGGSL